MTADQVSRFGPTNDFVPFGQEEIEQSIVHRFDEMVRRYPDHLAIKTESEAASYRNLNHAANGVAQALLERLGEAQESVALLLEPDAGLIPAILGTLKAAKIYVPLDTSLPVARLAVMLEESQACLIVTNERNQGLARELARGVIPVLDMGELDQKRSAENPNCTVSADSLAYILFTSGSTGRPKGVVENHRNVLHYTMNYTNYCHICADDRLTLLHPPGSVTSARDLFGALLNGASIHPFDTKRRDLSHLAGLFLRNGITVCYAVPTVFRHFAASLTGKEHFPTVRLLRLSSEAIYKSDMELYKKTFPDHTVLAISFGTTESGTSTFCFINKSTMVSQPVVPLGYPADGIEILLLDDDGKPVRPGEIGEMAIKSVYLSPGYWGRPDLTKAAFLPDPSGGPARIYRTGDLARMEPDGCLIHCGRKDFQVKIGGARVEIAEIETTLLEHPTVREAAVKVSGHRIAAYIVPASEKLPSVRALQDFLGAKLAAPMIPSKFVFLEALPQTPTGKVDRLSLPDPNQLRPELAMPFIPPETPVEETIAKIYAETLSLDRVGAHDNFWELGGNSLFAMQVISRVREVMGVNLPMELFLEGASVARLAALVVRDQMDRLSPEEIAQLLAEIECLSEEEARSLLERAWPNKEAER